MNGGVSCMKLSISEWLAVNSDKMRKNFHTLVLISILGIRLLKLGGWGEI